ncbi:MAG: hypothetical protein AAGB22_04880, partial [Bacteroidota bacterium]
MKTQRIINTIAGLAFFAGLSGQSYAQAIPQADKNYRIEAVYDDQGNVLSYQQVYLDKLGRAEQVQLKDLEDGRVLVQQTAYDEFGRAAVHSLPAPVYTGSTDYFQEAFMQHSGATPERFSAAHFDL